MVSPPSTGYRCTAPRAAAAVAAGVVALAAGYLAALLVAYALVQGTVSGATAPDGSSYLASDIHAVARRSLMTFLVALMVWPLVHYSGQRGPRAMLVFALGVGAMGFLSFARDSGPLDRLWQYLAYAAPTALALLLAWRIAYRRA